MARSKENDLLQFASGRIGKQLVIKNYPSGTVISKRPDMSKVKWSPEQDKNRDHFREATLYANEAIKDPKRKAKLQKQAKPGQSAHNVAVSEYYKLLKSGAAS